MRTLIHTSRSSRSSFRAPGQTPRHLRRGDRVLPYAIECGDVRKRVRDGPIRLSGVIRDDVASSQGRIRFFVRHAGRWDAILHEAAQGAWCD